MENDDRCLDSPSFCNKFGELNPIKGNGPLGKGDSRKEAVKKVQEMLKKLGYDLGNAGPDEDGVDGIFGQMTYDAIKDFQEDETHRDWEGKALLEDVKVGPRTSDALNREMVGIWYDFYQTDIKITEGNKIITVTSKFLSDTGIDLKDLQVKEEVKIIVKGEVKLARYGVDLTKVDENWVPNACNNRIEFTARTYVFLAEKWVFPGKKRKIMFELKKVSNEPGVCMNYPKKNTSNDYPDLFFADDDPKMKNFEFDNDGSKTKGSDCPTEILANNDNPAHSHHYQKATTKEAIYEITAIIRCEDYGAFGTLEASANNCETLLPREKNSDVSGNKGANTIKIPLDENDNHIADNAKDENGEKMDDGAKADKDIDPNPTGQPNFPGDGLTNYEEYRGFIIGGGGIAKKEHKMTSITQKDLFIYIEHSELSAHLSYFSKTGVKAHVLYDPDLYDGNTSRVINFNKTKATKGEQHGLWLRKENGPNRGVTYFSKLPYIPGNCTKVTIMVQTIKNEGIANMLDRVVAHELGHAIGMVHHGDGTGTNPSHHVCNGNNYYNRSGLETSGNINCIMRYTGFARGWCHDTPHHRHPTENPPIVGNIYCNSGTGTGINNPGAGHFRNDATKGNCQAQIRVKDW